MQLTEQQQLAFLYDTFLTASKDTDLRPAGATAEQLTAHMAGWKDGLFIDSLQQVAKQRALKAQAPKKSLAQRLLSRR